MTSPSTSPSTVITAQRSRTSRMTASQVLARFGRSVAQFHHIKWSCASYRNKAHKENHIVFTLNAHITPDNGKELKIAVARMLSAGLVVRGRSPESFALAYKRKNKMQRKKARLERAQLARQAERRRGM